MAGLLSWFRERLSPEATPRPRRARSNAWLGDDAGNDERREASALAVTGTSTSTSTSTTAGAASASAEVGDRRAALAASTRPSKTPRHGTGATDVHDVHDLGRSSIEQDGAATRPREGLGPGPLMPPPPASASGAAPAAQYARGARVNAPPGVGGFRAVAGGMSGVGMMAVTPRTPVRRWSHEGEEADAGVGTRSVTRGEGGGRAAAAAAAAAGVPPGYTYGMAVLPTSTPRRLIMAAAHSSRVRPASTTTSTAASATGARSTGGASSRYGSGSGSGSGYGYGYGSGYAYGSGGRGRTFGGSGSLFGRGVMTTTSSTSGETGAFANRGLSSFSSNSHSRSQRTSGIGDQRGGSSTVRGVGAGFGGVFKSAAARNKKHAAYLEQYGRQRQKSKTKKTNLHNLTLTRHRAEGRAKAARGAGSHEILAVRGLNNLRSKARKTLEKQALEIQGRNPEGAELLRKDARHIENWGREAAEGARREAEANALRLSQALARKEAEQAAAKHKIAAAVEAQALAREKEKEEARAQEEEAARLKAEEEEEEEARLAEAAAAAAAQEEERLELSPEQQEQVAAVWISPVDGADDHEVAVSAYNDMVSKGSMRTLHDGVWLGDEVINVYMKSLQARNREAVASGQQVPKCGIMSSFFYTQLSDSGRGYRYQGVKRFLKKAKIDLFDLDKFMFPVNVNMNHWTLAVINFRLQRLEYYDSMGGAFEGPLFEHMARFVDDESKNKRGGQGMDISDWPAFNYAKLPRQRNCIDCGVFASMFADRLSKGRPLSFSQSDIGLFRQVMTLAILRGERVPTEEEAFLEDGGTVPPDAPAWWDPPQEDADEDDDDDDVDDDEEEEEDEVDEVDGGGGDDDEVGEAEDDGGDNDEWWKSGLREEEAAPGGDAEGGGVGGGEVDLTFDDEDEEPEQGLANGFDLAAAGAHEEQARAVDLDLSSKNKNKHTSLDSWSTFPGEQINGGGSPAWATDGTNDAAGEGWREANGNGNGRVNGHANGQGHPWGE